jgi:hypothetical protein
MSVGGGDDSFGMCLDGGIGKVDVGARIFGDFMVDGQI